MSKAPSTQPKVSPETQAELQAAYYEYFQQVLVDKIGGCGRIQHRTACEALVKQGKLRKSKYGYCKYTVTDKQIEQHQAARYL